MRNRYPGICYRCGELVEVGEGHFEMHKSRWLTQHADCAIKYRGTKVHYKDAVPERAAKSKETG